MNFILTPLLDAELRHDWPRTASTTRQTLCHAPPSGGNSRNRADGCNVADAVLRHAAVDATQFQPAAEPSTNNGRVTVVALSRLVYRKGVDLLNVVVPAVCRRHPHVDFIIGGLPLESTR